MDLHRSLDRFFKRYPDRTAFVDRSGKEYSSKELEEEVKSYSAGLKELGLETGDTLALMTENRGDSLILVMACWYSGITVAEVKPRTEAANIQYFLEDSDSNAFVFEERFRDRVEKAGLDTEPRISIEEFEKGGRDAIDPGKDLSGEPASFSYTSGTTGTPKGVAYTHERMLHHMNTLLVRDEVVNGDRVCLIYPHYGVGNLEMLASLSAGATLYLPPDKEPESVLETIEEEEITSIGGVPTQLKALAENADGFDTSSLRYVHTGSGVLTEEVYRMAKEELCETVCTSYGSSEAGETLYSLQDSIAIGRPTRLQRVRLVEEGSKDPEAVVEGTGSGELIVKADSPSVFDGYLNKPEKTDEVLIDGWYFTGDIIYRDSEGMFWFRGRDDDMIISGGENISPVEVEDAMLSHPDVEEAGAVGIDDEKWGERVVGFVETDRELTEEELDQHCRDTDLEDFKRPKEYIFVDEMPLNETGGVERKKLRDMY